MPQHRRSCPSSHAVLQLLPRFAAEEKGPRAADDGVAALLRRAPCGTDANTPAPAPALCLTCFTASIADLPGAPPLSSNDVRRGANLVMETLAACAPDTGEDALQSWARALLRFDGVPDSTSSVAGALHEVGISGNSSSSSRGGGSIGSALADLLVRLFAFAARDMSVRVRALDAPSPPSPPHRTARPPAPAAADEDVNARWVVLVDLAQLLFSCWELLLQLAPSPQAGAATEAAGGGRRWSPLPSPDAVPAAPRRSPTASTVATLVLGDTLGGATDTDVHSTTETVRGASADTVAPHPPSPFVSAAAPSTAADAGVAQATAAGLHALVEGLLGALCGAADADAGVLLSHAATTTSSLQTHEAMLSFHTLCHHVPLLRRLLETSPHHFRCLSRRVLPRLLVLREVPARAPTAHAKGKSTASQSRTRSTGRHWAACSAATALCALLSILHGVVTAAPAASAAAAAAQPGDASALARIASQLTGGTAGPAPSPLAERDGAPLLASLLHALQVSLTVPFHRRRDGGDGGRGDAAADNDDDGGIASSATQLHQRLRLQTLRLLHALCRAPPTRDALLACPPPPNVGGVSTGAPSSGPGGLDEAAGAGAGTAASPTWRLMKALMPLLLATETGAHGAELTALTCDVLQVLLRSESAGCLRGDAVEDGHPQRDGAGQRGRGHDVTSVGPVRAATATSVSRVTWTALVAERLADYAAIAVNLCCTPEAVEPLVGLLECAACTMHRARRVLPLLAVQGDEPRRPPYGDPADAPLPPPWQSQQDWRVVFRVAALRVELFERLLRGPVLHDALRGRQLNWDDVLDAIEGVVTSVPPAGSPAPSLFAFLRCLEALAEGMGGSVAGLWSSKLHALLHAVLSRVEPLLRGSAAPSTVPPLVGDATCAMQAWVALVTGRALRSACEDDDPGTDLWRTLLSGTTRSSSSSSSTLTALESGLHPLVHRLLLRVVALYLPAAGPHLLHPLAVLLLYRFGATRELVTRRCTGGLDDPSTRPAALEESRSLLQIAATLMDSLHGGWACLLPPHLLQADARPGVSAGAALASSPYAPLDSADTQNPIDTLLDSLFALYPSAPDVQEARAALLQALMGLSTTPAGCLDTAPYMCAASLADVVVACAADTQATLLLRLAALGCRPPVTHDVLVTLLQQRCLCLRRLVEVWNGGGDVDVVAKAGLAEGAEGAEEDGLETADEELDGDGEEEAASEDPADPALDVAPPLRTSSDDRHLLDELQVLLQLLVVRLVWFGSAPQLAAAAAAAAAPAVPSPQPLPDHDALRIFSDLDVRVLLSRVAGASGVQVGLCQQLAHLQARHRVDGHRLLKCFARSDTRSAETDTSAAAGGSVAAPLLSATAAVRHGPSAILFAAAVLSAVLCSPAHPTSARSPDRLALPCFLLPDVRHLDGGAGASDTRVMPCTWTHPCALLLTALFLCAREELLRHLHGLWRPPGARVAGSQPDEESRETSASQRCLAYVAAALRFRHCACERPAVSSPVAAGLAQEGRRRAMLATHVGRDHLLPLLLHRDRHGRWRDAALLSDRGVVAYTVTLVRLWGAVLFLLAPVMCAFADAALAGYAVDRVAQLQALTADELTRVVMGRGAAGELLRPLLQLLYVLLVRPSRGEVVRMHGGDITLFTLRVRSAAVAVMRSRDVADAPASTTAGSCVDVCVMASLVYLQGWRAMSGANGVGEGGLHAHTLAGAAAAAVADEVSEAGLAAVLAGETPFHASSPVLPWYGWVPVLRLRWLFTAAATPTDAARAAVDRARCVVLAGVEAALRLCGTRTAAGLAADAPSEAHERGGGSRRPRAWTPPPPSPPHPTPLQVSARCPPAEEHFAAALVLDWCAQYLLVAAPHHQRLQDCVRGEGGDGRGDALPAAAAAATMLVVAARLLYLLVHRYGTTLHGSVVLDSLALQLLHPAGPWRSCECPALAAGWGLAAALSLLRDPVACAVSVPRARVSVAEFLQRPEVAPRVRVPGPQPQPPAVQLEAAASRPHGADATTAAGSSDAVQCEIDAILRVLLALDAAYERHGQQPQQQQHCAAAAAGFALVPPGTRLVADEEATSDCFMQASVCSPYEVPAAVEGAPPLMLWLCDLAGGHPL